AVATPFLVERRPDVTTSHSPGRRGRDRGRPHLRWAIRGHPLEHARRPDPVGPAALRFGVAGAVLLPILVRHGIADAAGIGWGRGLVLAITAGGPYTLILYAGLALAP